MLAKKFGFGFGMAILLPMLIHYGVSTFSPSPKWQDYHDSSCYQSYQEKDAPKNEAKEKECKRQEDEYTQKRGTFEEKLFIVAAPIGIAAIIIGSSLSVQAIGAGLIFGGIFTLIDGYCTYWSELQDWMRFLSLLVAFIVLVLMGYVKFNKKEK